MLRRTVCPTVAAILIEILKMDKVVSLSRLYVWLVLCALPERALAVPRDGASKPISNACTPLGCALFLSLIAASARSTFHIRRVVVHAVLLFSPRCSLPA
jgi:hypothetical protein